MALLHSSHRRSERTSTVRGPGRAPLVLLDVDVDDGAAVLAVAAAHLARSGQVGPDVLERALLRREKAGSTGLGYGVAVPHARIVGISHALTMFLRTRRPVEFGAPGGEGVNGFFVIVVPADGDTDRHLALLASVASAFADPTFRALAANATSAEQISDALQGLE